jgi:hypothetical protein
MLATIATLFDNAMQAHQAKVLGNARAGKFQRIDEGIDVTLAGTQFLNNSDPVWMGNNAKDLGKLLGNQLTLWHISIPGPFSQIQFN